MQLKKLFTGLFILISVSMIAENGPIILKKNKIVSPADSVQLSINFLKKYILTSNTWQTENPEIVRTVKGLIHFAEDEHIDSILIKLGKFQGKDNFRYINRSPLLVSDSLRVTGYHSSANILEEMKKLDRAIWNGIDMNTIPLPEALRAGANHKIQPITAGDEKAIIRRTRIILPDSLVNVLAIPDSSASVPNDFSRIRKRQEARTNILELARLQYNNRIAKMDLDSVITAYRQYAIRVFSDSLQIHLRDSLKLQNKKILVRYNDSIVRSVNDTINRFVQILQRLAQKDSVSVQLKSLSGKPLQLWLRNNDQSTRRMYIKNEQNDSLRIKLMNMDKHALRIAIEDDVTFNRMAQKQGRDFVFEKFNPDQKLTKIQKKFNVITPWNLGGFGTFGLSQTYLNNWKPGGNSAFSFLMVLKGYANFSDNVIRWENSGEFRNGWIRQGGSLNQVQKNDDKLELISRLGVSAYKKWYYSAEIDFETQFFNGYKYPDKTRLISAFMSPSKTLFKLGFDYKPNNKFSLFLSPLSLKTIFVLDTAQIDQTKYGVSHNSRSFWEPGLNAEIRYRIDFSPQISYETKYKMFINFKAPFTKFDINWENIVVAQLTDRINTTFMLYMLYDDNVTFPTGKFGADKKEIFKPKLQTRELITVGFSYKINRHIYERRKVD